MYKNIYLLHFLFWKLATYIYADISSHSHRSTIFVIRRITLIHFEGSLAIYFCDYSGFSSFVFAKFPRWLTIVLSNEMGLTISWININLEIKNVLVTIIVFSKNILLILTLIVKPLTATRRVPSTKATVKYSFVIFPKNGEKTRMKSQIIVTVL